MIYKDLNLLVIFYSDERGQPNGQLVIHCNHEVLP